jgi:acyl-coenzyme A thioesterase PaaI-like protein
MSDTSRLGVPTSPAAAPGPRGLRIRDRLIEVDAHNCFGCGTLNNHGLQLELHTQGGRCWTEVELPERFEGWDGIAHGGIVATILDEVMAWALIDQDAWGLTARMTVAFKRPVAIGRRVRGEGWVVDTRRRVLRSAGWLVDAIDGTTLATAEGTYVAAPEDRKRELQARYGFRVLGDAPEAVAR